MADKYNFQVALGTANTPSIASDATALAANPARVVFMIQNLGTNALFVRYGAGATTSVFHVVLKASSVADDGTGGSVAMEGATMWQGVISVAGTSPRYTVTELTA